MCPVNSTSTLVQFHSLSSFFHFPDSQRIPIHYLPLQTSPTTFYLFLGTPAFWKKNWLVNFGANLASALVHILAIIYLHVYYSVSCSALHCKHPVSIQYSIQWSSKFHDYAKILIMSMYHLLDMCQGLIHAPSYVQYRTFSWFQVAIVLSSLPYGHPEMNFWVGS